jgi:hypothetical protein
MRWSPPVTEADLMDPHEKNAAAWDAGEDGRLNVARLEEQLLQYSARIRFAGDLTLLAAYHLK